MLDGWNGCVPRPIEIGWSDQHLRAARHRFDSRPESHLLVAKENTSAAIPDTNGGWKAKRERKAVARIAQLPHSERNGYALNVGEMLREATGEKDVAVGLGVWDRDGCADQYACALRAELRKGGSPARVVRSAPIGNHRFREDQEGVGMGEGDLLQSVLGGLRT